MTDTQWMALRRLMDGTLDMRESLAGFIIDSPWLPNWLGVSILDYLAYDQVWFDANLKAIETFPDAKFLPGFWAEYGWGCVASPRWIVGAERLSAHQSRPLREEQVSQGMRLCPG